MILEVKMPLTGTCGKRGGNYSNCPLKKRPIKYETEDDPMDSDSSSNLDPPSILTLEISEPENLSTKPQDLRISSGISNSLTVKAEVKILSPPPLGLVAGHRSDVPSPPTLAHRGLSPFPTTPSLYSPPHPFASNFGPNKGSTGPLEPISLNAPAVWPHVPPYIHFNYNARLTHHPQHHLFSPPAAATYPKSLSSHSLVSSQSHISPFRGSPPHISPPLKPEPSYPPIVKRELLSLSELNSFLQIENPKVKKEREDSSGYASTSPIHHPTRDSVISHSSNNLNHHFGMSHMTYAHHQRDTMSSGRSSCDSGVSSPTGSSGHSTASAASITPTIVNGTVRYKCPTCEKCYSTVSGLSKHVQFHCASQNKRSYGCEHCPKVYVSMGALKMHIRTHTLPCKCPHCGKCFSRPWLLQGHVRTHTGEKPFACQHCNRAFADRSNLRAHLQTHSEVKKYSCKHCAKTFSRMSLLSKHEDSGCNQSS